jgi:Family of unknown function (DUF6384)
MATPPTNITATNNISSQQTNFNAKAYGTPLNADLKGMVQILDIASAIKADKKAVLNELNVESERLKLAKQIKDAARLDGEDLSDDVINMALDAYFSDRFKFIPPKPSAALLFANIYIKRNLILAICSLILLLTFSYWLILSNSSPIFGVKAQQNRYKARASYYANLIEEQSKLISQIAKEKSLLTEVNNLNSLGESLAEKPTQDGESIERLEGVAKEINSIREELFKEYEVRIVSREGEKSGIDRYYTDDDGKRVSGYYLIVEAVAPDGSILLVNIRNSEDGTSKLVTKWAERVPEVIYFRILEDKKSDGRVDEYLFARKRRGYLNQEVVMEEDSGTPLNSLGQITSW